MDSVRWRLCVLPFIIDAFITVDIRFVLHRTISMFAVLGCPLRPHKRDLIRRNVLLFVGLLDNLLQVRWASWGVGTGRSWRFGRPRRPR